MLDGETAAWVAEVVGPVIVVVPRARGAEACGRVAVGVGVGEVLSRRRDLVLGLLLLVSMIRSSSKMQPQSLGRLARVAAAVAIEAGIRAGAVALGVEVLLQLWLWRWLRKVRGCGLLQGR